MRTHVMVAGAVVAACGTAVAQPFATGFEPAAYTGSAAGSSVAGQDAWYTPAVASSIAGNVFTYTGNALGLSSLAAGGTQFLGGRSDGTNFMRAQRDIDFSAATGDWRVTYDFNGRFAGTLPAVNNLASFSLQPSTTARFFQTLKSWSATGGPMNPPPGSTSLPDNTLTGDKFHVAIGRFSATAPTGVPIFDVPTIEWVDLPVDNWFRISVRFNFQTGLISEVSLQNLTAGTPAVVTNVASREWYLQGGPNPTTPLPTAVRFFVGGLVDGNIMGIDNFSIGPDTAGACYANCDGSTGTPALTPADFVCFLNKFRAGDPYANCDGSTGTPALTPADFVCFLNKFRAGC